MHVLDDGGKVLRRMKDVRKWKCRRKLKLNRFEPGVATGGTDSS